MRERLQFRHEGNPLYVIGDVHGAAGVLRELEEAILEETARFGRRPTLVMLGDLIDRGPHSAQVLDRVMTSSTNFDRVCLAGNHEMVCADYLAGRVPYRVWEAHGASSTLMSFGIDPYEWMSRAPDRLREAAREAFGARRIAFLDQLPVMMRAGRIVMVHAGVRPGVALDEQSDVDLTTIRKAFFDHSHRLPYWVVHGHTPVPAPLVTDRRINVDTKAWSSGKLTALRLFDGHNGFLQT